MPALARVLAVAVLAAGLSCSNLGSRRGPPPDPQAVTVEGATGNRFVAAARDGELVARLRIDGRAVAEAVRPPINLALVIDTSGSMEGAPIEHARAAALALVDSLATGDRLAVIGFDSTTQVLVPSTRLDPAVAERVRAKLRAMRARGTTDLAGGLAAGLQQVSAALGQGGVNRIVLLSDGVPNEPAPILGLAQSARGSGVAITALGLGLDYDETLLAQVAQQSGGSFHYVEDSRHVAEVFHREVLRLQRVVARNLTLQLQPGPGVTVSEVVGQSTNAAGNRGVYVSMGDLAEGEQRDVIVRLAVGGRRAGSSVEILDGVLTFDDAIGGAGRLERRVYLSARATDDPAALVEGHNPDVDRSAARAAAAAATVQAIALARAGQLDEGQRLLDEAQRSARAAASAHEDAELASSADAMGSLREALPTLPPAPAPSPPPRAAVGEYAAPAEAPAAASSTVRRAHDDAMRYLQSN